MSATQPWPYIALFCTNRENKTKKQETKHFILCPFFYLLLIVFWSKLCGDQTEFSLSIKSNVKEVNVCSPDYTAALAVSPVQSSSEYKTNVNI